MTSYRTRRAVVRRALIALIAMLLLSAVGMQPASSFLKSGIAYAQGNALEAALLAQGDQRQVIQFNPSAALQKRIFSDRFVPNSAEFSFTFEGVAYAAQRAENLSSGAVRVYYVQVGDWGNIRFTEGGTPLGDALLAAAQEKQVIQFNPGAALQQRMFAEGFVPNSSEYTANVNGASYSAQRAENLATGQVRVYYVFVGDWANVRTASRGSSTTASFAPPPAPVPAPQPAPQPVARGNCDPSYPDVCIASPPPDLDCGQISHRNFRVEGSDPHRFDGDHDGVGCER